jgi:hypothetical protein
MPLQYEFEPKLTDIGRLAREMYRKRFRGLGLMLDESGLVVRDPHGLYLSPPPDLAEENARWREFLGTVDTLCARIRQFYVFDAVSLFVMGGQLTGSQSGTEAGSAGSVDGRLNYAATVWMPEVRELVVREDWTGTAAGSFQDNFVQPFGVAAYYQMCCLRELSVTAYSWAEGVSAAIKDLRAIVDSCIAALGGPGGGGDGVSRHDIYNMIGILSGVVGYVPHPLVAVAANTIGLTVQFISMLDKEAEHDKTDGPKPELAVDGASAPDVISSTMNALSILERAISDLDLQLDSGLRQDLWSPDLFRNSRRRLDSPTLASGDPLGDPTGTRAPGIPASKDPVVANIVNIYRAGKVNIAGAADEYSQARSMLEACEPDPGLKQYFKRSVDTFNEGRKDLLTVLSDMTVALHNTSNVLIAVAVSYEVTDEQSSEVFRRIGEIQAPTTRSSDTVPTRGPY